MNEIFLVFIGACLVNNLVLDYLVGVSPALASSRRFETALGLSLAMLLLVPLTTLSTHCFTTSSWFPMNSSFSRYSPLSSV